MILSKSKLFKFLKIGAVVVFVWAIAVLAIPQMSSEEFRELVDKLGIFGPILVIGYITFSHILAPLVATPIALSSIVIFGIYETMFYIYLGGVISAVINFYIARKFGRGLVAKLAGQRGVREIDEFTETSGVQVLILARVFGFALFEIVSYAYGLTLISFKKYFVITAVFSAIPALVFAILFQSIDFSAITGIFVWGGVILFTGLLFSYGFKKYLGRREG